MSYVSLLRDDFDLSVITTGAAAIGGAPDWVTRLSWPDEFTWNERPRSFMNGLYARLLGRRYHIPGLRAHLRGSDIVQAGEAASECSYQSALFKKELGYKLMLSASENQPILADRSRAHQDRIRFTLEHLDHVFAIPNAARDRLVDVGVPPNRITVIGHGIDCARFSPVKNVAKAPADARPLRVGFCGRFNEEKGLEHLIEATRGIDVDVILLGSGPEKEKLKASGGNRVFFLPPLPYEEIHGFYHEIDIFVLPSIPLPGLVEQFGFVLLEAMASEVPIIATSVGGIPEVIGDAGILVPPADPIELSRAIETLANDRNLRDRLTTMGRRRVLEQFDRRIVADKMATVYRGLLQ